MKIREPILPPPWYPRDPEQIMEFLASVQNKLGAETFQARGLLGRAAIAPHAGWHYSGRIAARSVSRLDPSADTVVIIGGHLPAGAPFLFAGEDEIRTPFGSMPIDSELRERLVSKLDGKNDRYQDNTVEVLVPMVHAFFPNARLLWVRFPTDIFSFEAGKNLNREGSSLGRRLAVIGSTDLTHYGVNYDFAPPPRGKGKSALDWVRHTNDTAFIQAVLGNDPKEVLRRSEEDHSACSAGAVLGVLGFVNQNGITNTELLEYGTSADVMGKEIPDSFVGYASILWSGV